MTDISAVTIDPPHVAKRDAWFTPVERRMKFLAWPAAAGAVCLVIGFLTPPDGPLRPLWLLGGLLCLPLLLYAYILPIWHWKDRYRGDASHLWGAVLLLETSGWAKLVYWFRHILPDWKASGRYLGPYNDQR